MRGTRSQVKNRNEELTHLQTPPRVPRKQTISSPEYKDWTPPILSAENEDLRPEYKDLRKEIAFLVKERKTEEKGSHKYKWITDRLQEIGKEMEALIKEHQENQPQELENTTEAPSTINRTKKQN